MKKGMCETEENKLRVAVLFGGCSDEYSVSLKSACAMLEGLDKEKYEIIMVGITKDGRWLRYEGSLKEIKEDRWAESEACVPAFISPSRELKGLAEIRNNGIHIVPIDVVLPALHGKNGEDGTIQGLLQMAGIPYAGCGVLASAAGMDKDIARKLAEAAGVLTAKAAIFHSWDDMADITRSVWKFQYPLYVKPACGGSSIGITQVKDPSTLLSAVKKAFEYDDKILIEENVPGFEVGCAVMGRAELFTGAVDELQLHGAVFDYKEKYNLTKTVHYVPARVAEETAQRIKNETVKVYRALECSGIARVDFFLTPDNRIVFNEINTMPGFTTGSRCPKMLVAGGLNFEQILDKLIDNALERKESGKDKEDGLTAGMMSHHEFQTMDKESERLEARTEKRGLVEPAALAI